MRPTLFGVLWESWAPWCAAHFHFFLFIHLLWHFFFFFLSHSEPTSQRSRLEFTSKFGSWLRCWKYPTRSCLPTLVGGCFPHLFHSFLLLNTMFFFHRTRRLCEHVLLLSVAAGPLQARVPLWQGPQALGGESFPPFSFIWFSSNNCNDTKAGILVWGLRKGHLFILCDCRCFGHATSARTFISTLPCPSSVIAVARCYRTGSPLMRSWSTCRNVPWSWAWRTCSGRRRSSFGNTAPCRSGRNEERNFTAGSWEWLWRRKGGKEEAGGQGGRSSSRREKEKEQGRWLTELVHSSSFSPSFAFPVILVLLLVAVVPCIFIVSFAKRELKKKEKKERKERRKIKKKKWQLPTQDCPVWLGEIEWKGVATGLEWCGFFLNVHSVSITFRLCRKATLPRGTRRERNKKPEEAGSSCLQKE